MSYESELKIAQAAAEKVRPGTFLAICAGAMLRKKQCSAEWGGIAGYARYGLTGSFHAPECWERAQEEASRNCKPGRANWTQAKVLQEKYEQAVKKLIKREIREALHEAGMKQPPRIFLFNSAHHDYLVVGDDGGAAFANQGTPEGRELLAIRTRLNLTQEELAGKLGIAPNSLARIERGEMGVKEPVLRLARTFTAPTT